MTRTASAAGSSQAEGGMPVRGAMVGVVMEEGALLQMQPPALARCLLQASPGAVDSIACSCRYRCGPHLARCVGDKSDSLFRQGRQARKGPRNVFKHLQISLCGTKLSQISWVT